VHVFVHGGYWHRLDKTDFSFVAGACRETATVVVNYALVPTVDLDELVRQVRASVAWVHANARSFGGDPARITVSGHSAGGHLVAMLLATDWPQFGVPADVVKAGCAISGLYDLEPIRLCYLNEVLGLTPESARHNSPVHLKPTGRAPLVLAVGADEGPEYHRQTTDLAAACRSRSRSARRRGRSITARRTTWRRRGAPTARRSTCSTRPVTIISRSSPSWSVPTARWRARSASRSGWGSPPS